MILARAIGSLAVVSALFLAPANANERPPNIVLLMADDQGWGDVAYNGNAVLKTPVLDEMASTALRFDRFYAAAPVCSPTRGSVLTGRHPNRFGCFSWGHTLRPEEVTLAEALQTAGYVTGHFGKWHLGAVDASSPVSPGNSGFDQWFSSPNFFENSPLMSRNGKVVKTDGEGSQVTVDAALDFIRAAAAKDQPFLAVVWFGSPHTPHIALEADRDLYADQPARLQHYLVEITAMDRAIGSLRSELRKLQIADDTLVWYTSDNGAAAPGSTGGLRGKKATLWEGGIRVPAIIEWPSRVKAPRTTDIACGTVDICPTLLDLTGISVPNQPPLDGISLRRLLEGNMTERAKPLGFWVYPSPGQPVRSHEILAALGRQQSSGDEIAVEPAAFSPRKEAYSEADLPGHAAWIDGNFKLHRIPAKDSKTAYELYDLAADPREEHDLAANDAERASRMQKDLEAWQRSVIRSLNGQDYASERPE
jgi:arylsulfatase A-like enzyme